MEALPFVDELSASCAAPAGRLWDCLITSLPRSSAGSGILAGRSAATRWAARLHRSLR